MNSFFNYLLQSGLCLTVLYLVFKLLFETQATFTFNRFFLLGSVAFSVVIPLLSIPVSPATGPLIQPDIITGYQLPEIALATPNKSFLISEFITGLYCLVLFLLLIRFLRQLYCIYRLKKKPLAFEKHPDYTLIRTNAPVAAFTFGNTIYLSTNHSLTSEEEKVILAHELVHVKQRHTLDLLLLEVVLMLHWFNPVVWFIKSSLRNQHEFVADRHAVQTAATFTSYTRQIICQALGTNSLNLTHSFSNSQLKKRIIMMQKTASIRSAIARAAVALPIAVVLFYIVSCDDAKQEILPVVTEQTAASADAKKVAKQAEVMPSFKGDETAFYTYLTKNIKVPDMSKQQEGKVFASFVVGKEGEIRDVKILKGMGEPFDTEVIRVLQGMPAWNPAIKNGQPVAMEMVVPVVFKSQPVISSAQNNATKNMAKLPTNIGRLLVGGC